jgi:hypothetical protein
MSLTQFFYRAVCGIITLFFFIAVLEIDLRALFLLGKYSTYGLYHQPKYLVFSMQSVWIKSSWFKPQEQTKSGR